MGQGFADSEKGLDMPNEKTYTFDFKGVTESPLTEDIPYCKEELIFQAGIFEATKRYIKTCEDYQIKKNMLMALMGIEDEDE